MLYSTAIAGLTDITSGNAPGCGTPGFNVSIICNVSPTILMIVFHAGHGRMGPRLVLTFKGLKALIHFVAEVTGLGTPLVKKLLSIVGT